MNFYFIIGVDERVHILLFHKLLRFLFLLKDEFCKNQNEISHSLNGVKKQFIKKKDFFVLVFLFQLLKFT